ncbi:endonuclease-reverse transcriptase [Elysia marginata]|uniref:Endonuclease-reverse transcriptase n=1 Tax=Elysia marginata TaxID=1093978 RepID=A0AAV4EGH8_9GAST|nr:endonuclease-reverse transcriptase [Elysia marginata]
MRWTWHSPGGEYRNPIDYIMIKRRFQSNVNIAQTRSFPGADVGSDHELAMMKFALRLKKNKKRGNIRIKFDVDKLKGPNILTTFQTNIGGRFAPLHVLDNNQDLTPDDLVETFNETLSEEASKLLGKPRVKKKKKWITDEIVALCDQRRISKKRKKDPEGGKQYRETNLKVKRSIKEVTEKWIEDQCEDIENSLKYNTELTKSQEKWFKLEGSDYRHALLICNKILQIGVWPKPWTLSLVITLPKKGNLKLCQNYHTISLISHPSKVMLKVVLNRLKPNIRILMEEYLQHQQELHHVFIDYKKASMRKYYINSNLITVIENLYNKAKNAVFCNNNIGDWFRTTVGVRQGSLLSPTLFNTFLERIMTYALEDHFGIVSIGGRPITNLRFADGIDGLAGNVCELASLVEKLDKASSNFDMEISAEKTKIMTNCKESSKKEMKIIGQILKSVTKFKYLGSIISDEGSKPVILSRMA